MASRVLCPLAESDLAEILDYIGDQSGSRRIVEGVLTDFVGASRVWQRPRGSAFAART